MAIFHLHVKNISRGDGRSVVAAAAYRAGEVLVNEAEERLSAFGGKRDVVFTEICLPAGAPAWMAERGRLWNAVEAREARKDSRLAKEIECALPRELPRADAIAVARAFADMYTSAGYVVDLAVHDDGTGHNPHAHFMLTLRQVQEAGFGEKIAEANARAFVTEARTGWAKLVNGALGRVGSGVEVDHRSLRSQGVGRTPTSHRGIDRVERLQRREQRRRATPEVAEPIRAFKPTLAREEAAGEPAAARRVEQTHNQPNREGEGQHMPERNTREAGDLQARIARLRELPQPQAGLAYPALIDVAEALASGDEAAARAALDKAEAGIVFEFEREENALPALDPNGDIVSVGELKDAQADMVQAMEHETGPAAEARETLAARQEAARHGLGWKLLWQQDVGDGDWLDREIARGLEQMEAERIPDYERRRER